MTQLVPVRVTQTTEVGVYSISTFVQANQAKTKGSGHTRQGEPCTKQQQQMADVASREMLTCPGSFSVKSDAGRQGGRNPQNCPGCAGSL